MDTVPPPKRGDNDVQRRSQRVMLKVSVVVQAQEADTSQSQKKRGQSQ
jgi:hypothetical protein